MRTVVDELQAPELVIEAGDDVTGTWDPDSLEQVVSNLAGNAISHGASGAQVRLALRGESDRVVLSVHNAGPPIPEALRAVLFDPFRRGANDAKSRAMAGLGLGLFISREIVSAHGGTIAVTSSETEGTTFSVTLPRHAQASPEPRHEDTRPTRYSSSRTIMSSSRCLPKN